MVQIDHNKNINRIIEKIKADPKLYDNGKTKGKFRTVIFGDPDNNDLNAIAAKPAIIITTKNTIQNTSYPFGFAIPDNQKQLTVHYEMVLITQSRAKSEFAQKELYDLLKNLRNLANADPLFADTKTKADPIFTRSVLTDPAWDARTRGQLTTSVTVTLMATIGTTYTIEIPNVGVIPLLSKPNNPEGIIFTEDRTQNGTNNRVLSSNGNFGSLYVEYESTAETDQKLRDKFGDEENITLTTPQGSRVIHVKYIEVNPTVQFDQIERTVLHMELVQ